jgi:predicted nucleotidyltransferase component of viral defense system
MDVTRPPGEFAELRAWARSLNISYSEARDRYAQFAVLRGIAATPRLRQTVVFKGGNALDFVWHPNRSTRDLDFSLDMALAPSPLHLDAFAASFQQDLSAGLARVAPRLGMGFRVVSVRQQPPGPNRTLATFRASVAYALPDEPTLLVRLRRGETINRSLPVELSINEVIGADQMVELEPGALLRVATLEDIVAEKLRALLQQVVRNRSRAQDLLDIAVVLRGPRPLDPLVVSTFLRAKSMGRSLVLSRSAFHHPEIAARAREGYDDLRQTTRVLFVPFDEALAAVLDLVDRLSLDETPRKDRT